MTISEYAEKLVELINARPSDIDLDKLMYEVYVRAKIAESRRDRINGHWTSNDKVMEKMWLKINSKSAGCEGQKKTST